MPTQTLTGTLEEQCAFLYQLAQEKLAQGNYTGAAHIFQEIIKHAPDYRDTVQLLAETKRKKAEQRNLLLSGLFGAMLAVGVGTLLQFSNDLLFILLAIVGAVLGFVIANAFVGRRTQTAPNDH